MKCTKQCGAGGTRLLGGGIEQQGLGGRTGGVGTLQGLGTGHPSPGWEPGIQATDLGRRSLGTEAAEFGAALGEEKGICEARMPGRWGWKSVSATRLLLPSPKLPARKQGVKRPHWGGHVCMGELGV